VRVLILASEYPRVDGDNDGSILWGGIGAHIRRLGSVLGRMALDVRVCCYDPHHDTVVQDGPVSIFRMTAPGSHDDLDETARMRTLQNQLFPKICSFIEDWNSLDIVHCHHHSAFPIALHLRQLTGAAIVTTVHYLRSGTSVSPDPVPAYVYTEELGMCTQSDIVIAVSEWLKIDITRTFAIPGDGIRVIYAGIDSRTCVLDPRAVRYWRGLVAPRNEYIIMYSGRFGPEKGVPLLLASAVLVCNSMENVRYAIAGGSAQAIDQLRARFAQYDVLKDRVAFLGWLGETQLEELRRAVDIAVVPSLVETFGLSALEAMASCVPVVATRVGGLSEVVSHNEAGLLVPCMLREDGWSKNVSRLACAQLYLLKNPRVRERLGKAGRDRAANTFSLEQMARRTINAYIEARALTPGVGTQL
jgi:glycosyltransferase involved in cell wall biosynthesis